eukprot:2687812-Ditylum_brightwellii.AAC.1
MTEQDPQNFHKYIDTLDSWEHQLLPGCEFIEDKEEIIHILAENINIFLITNNGAADRFGYFGW